VASAGDLPPTKPTAGTACARAESGHAAPADEDRFSARPNIRDIVCRSPHLCHRLAVIQNRERFVQDSTGGKQKLGPISKQGGQYLRRILVVGAHAVLRRAKQNPEKYPWVTQLLARRPFKVVAVALANKMARVAWALLVRGGKYRAPAIAAAA
jgi:transposase